MACIGLVSGAALFVISLLAVIDVEFGVASALRLCHGAVDIRIDRELSVGDYWPVRTSFYWEPSFQMAMIIWRTYGTALSTHIVVSLVPVVILMAAIVAWAGAFGVCRDARYCESCGYDLSGAANRRCPECRTLF